MDEREELESLRREFASERDELEALRKQFSSPEPQPSFAQVASQRAWGTVGAPIAAASRVVDRFVGAPIRSAVDATLFPDIKNQEQGTPLEEGIKQFGRDPERAPSWSKIAEKAGLSPEKNISFPGIKNFGTPQSRFYETKISPADIGGAVAGTLTDPLTYLPGPNAVQRFGKFGQMATKQVGSNIVEPAVKLGIHSGLSIKPEVYNYYKKHFDRLKGKAYTGLDPVIDEVKDVVDSQKYKYDMAVKAKDEAEKDFSRQIKTLHKGLDTNAYVDVDWVSSIGHLIDKVDSGKLAELDKRAMEQLKKQNFIAPKRDIQQIIENEAKSILAGNPDTIAAKEKLLSLSRNLDQIYDEYIDGPMIRKWIQDLDQSLTFNPNRDASDALYQQKAKDIRYKVQEAMRSHGEIPGEKSEYRKIMEEMSRKLALNKAMAGLFANDEKGIKTFQKLLKSNNPVLRQHVENTIRDWATENGYYQVNEILDELPELRADFASAKETPKDQFELYESVAPDQYDDLIQKQLAEMSEQDAYEGVKSLSEVGSIESTLKNVGQFHGGTAASREKLQNVSDIAGKDFAQEAQDQGNLLEFSKERPQGSRLATPGTIVGGLAGLVSQDPYVTAAAAGVGGLAGMAFDKRGGPIARGIIDASLSSRDAINRMFQKLQSPSPGFASYATKLSNVAAQRGTQAAVMYHQLMYNNDPEYRRALAE